MFPVTFNLFSLLNCVEQKFWNFFNLVFVYKKASDIVNVTLSKTLYLVWIKHLIINFPCKVYVSCKSIYSSSNSITEILMMTCGKEVVLSFHSKIFPVHEQIWKVLVVFILNWGTIAEVNYAFIEGISCFWVIIDKDFQ